MDETRFPALKSFAADLARDLAADSGRLALELIDRLELLPPASEPPPAPEPGRIGIWQARSEDGVTYFERQDDFGPSHAWADVQRFPLKTTKRRVVLVGESVARGFFYDPQLSPAQVLEGFLSSPVVPGGVEVVDLARTAATADQLVQLLLASRVLEPDVFVIFAGNNWAAAPAAFTGALERHQAATILRRQGVAGLKSFNEQQFEATIGRTVETLLHLLPAHVPVVFIIPEFNCADWRWDDSADVPLLAEGDNQRWLAELTGARAALAAGRLEEAAAHARKMVELDRGTAAAGFVLLADLERRAGRLQEARELLERARDAHNWDPSLLVPRPATSTQAVLRRCSGQGRAFAVDLPRVFADYLAGEPPDRRLFLDYCHLTAKGIHLAMAAAAERIAPLLGGGAVPFREFLAGAVPPSPELAAEAHFAAAVHNAHWGQPYEVVRYLCGSAAESSRRVALLMRDYLEVQVRCTPPWACPAAGRMLANGAKALFRYFMWADHRLFDEVLLTAISDSLEAVGLPTREDLENLRRAERGLAAGDRVDLTDDYYLSSWLEHQRQGGATEYRRCYAASVRFPLVCRSAMPVRLELTLRQPSMAVDGAAATLAINGTVQWEIPLARQWTTHSFTAGRELLRPGVNRIEVGWPPPVASLDSAAHRIERGQTYDLLPVFGEIHSFIAVGLR